MVGVERVRINDDLDDFSPCYEAVKVIPLKIHGFVELAVGPSLIILPFLLNFAEQTSAAAFYGYSGILIFVVWVFTDYKHA